ncbi:MAG: hypothetical protein HYR90_04155 [Candidatus Andersenbacteria bacterium]|nr:hypothetical protein [Candidatus Andersenbacteria bacterium]
MEQPPQVAPGKELKRPGKRRRGRGITLLLFLLFIAVVALFVWAEQQRREAVGQLQETEQRLEEIQQSTQQSGQERAQQVLEQVRRHMDIPTEPAPTVATIVDVNRLRESSPFYDKADNGDNLVITENRAILYDPDRDIVIDVVPVQINRQSPTPTTPGASPSPAASPSTTPSSTPTPTPAS